MDSKGNAVAVKCWASDCGFKSIREALGLKAGAFFEDELLPATGRYRVKKHKGGQMGGSGFDNPTLKQLAEKSGVTVEHLRSLGWTEGWYECERRDKKALRVQGCRVPYYRREGEESFAKIRASLEGAPKYLNERLGPACLYGEWMLDEYRQRENPVLVLEEGETDFAAFTSQDIPVAGIPGSGSVASVLTADHVKGFKILLIVREPGESGEKFCKNLAKHLPSIGYKGLSTVVDLDGKDAAELLVETGPDRFKDAFRAACLAGTSLSKIALKTRAASLLIRGDQAVLKPTRYLMYPHVPIGYLTLWCGLPGMGKSYSTMMLAALLSRGKVMPVCDPERSELGTGRTLVFSADDTGDSVSIPRFIACGGDPKSILCYRQDMQRITTADLDLIREVVKEADPSLIIMDPYIQFVAEGASSSQQEAVIESLRPLCDLAREYNAALIGVGWAPKHADSAVKQFAGSIAGAGKMRSGVTVLPFEGGGGNGVRRGVVSHAKTNYSVLGDSCGYEITADPADPHPDVELSPEALEIVRSHGTFRFTGKVASTADELAQQASGSVSDKSSLRNAEEAIRSVLEGKGEVSSQALIDAQKASQIPWGVWLSARQSLGVTQRPDPEIQGAFLVGMPEKEVIAGEDCPF